VARWAWRSLLLHLLVLISPTYGELGVEISKKEESLLVTEFGGPLWVKWQQCLGMTSKCEIGGLLKELAVIFNKLRSGFNGCLGKKCTFNQAWCNLFFDAIFPKLENLQTACSRPPINDWPPQCTQVLVAMNKFQKSHDFELNSMCSIIQPGGTARDGIKVAPRCSSMALGMAKYHNTLSSCSAFTRGQCIDHFCKINTEFRWRARPRQVQKTLPGVNYSTYYPDTYVLAGCEDLTPYDEKACHIREDVVGMCDCICAGWKDMPPGQAVHGCAKNIDAYLLFGRFGVKDLKIESVCENSLCSLLSASKQRCPALKLPNMVQCKAMSLPDISRDKCPWRTHSGEDGVLECLDGHRCKPDEESWSCCFKHLGRARCPKDKPVMCDTLCSGSPTEYCCEREPYMCTARPCSPLLVPEEITMEPTTPRVTTTLPARIRQDDGVAGLTVRLPQGSWVWLILIIPCILGGFCVLLWKRAHKAAEWIDESLQGAKTPAELIADRNGPFHVVRRPEPTDDLPSNQRVLVKIVVDDLPVSKPLGLELIETKVARVHASGLKFGWQVADKIVQVGSFPVESFEEIWQRIQVERDRLPVTFLVERRSMAPCYLDFRGQPKPDRPDMQEDIERGATKTGTESDDHLRKGSHMQPSRSSSKIDDSRMSSKLEGVVSGSRTTSKLGDHIPGSRTTSKLLGGDIPGSRATSKLPGDRATSKLPGDTGIPSLRDAAMAVQEEGSEGSDYGDFAQPSAQDWWRECTTRAEAHHRKKSEPPKKRLRAKVVVDYLPMSAPQGVGWTIRDGLANILGVELYDTTILSILPQGEEFAWHVDDTIVQVGASPVRSAAEIWQQIQIERDHLPCTFVVTREPKGAGNLRDPDRVMENLKTIVITKGIKSCMKIEELKEVMGQFGQVDFIDMGTRGLDGEFLRQWKSGYLVQSFPSIRFRTRMGAEAAMTALKNGDIILQDTEATGNDRDCKLAGERKQDPVWHVPSQMPGSTPKGAKRSRSDDVDAVEPQSAHGFGEWWTEPAADGGESYHSSDGWSQWEMEEEDARNQMPTLWEEARAKKGDAHGAFSESVPYHAWLAQERDEEIIGDAKEWVCSVCARPNALTEPNCHVCHAPSQYNSSKLEGLAKAQILLPTERMGCTGAVVKDVKKKPDVQVKFRKDAWHRFIYEVRP